MGFACDVDDPSAHLLENRMELVSDFKTILLRAWSVRLALLSAFFSSLEALSYVLPYLGGIFPDKTLAGLGALAAIGAIGARIVDQPKMHGAEK
jgi:hypothetical protein